MDLWVINSMLFKLYLSYRVSMVSVESTIGCSIFIHGIEFHCRNLVIRFNLITLSIIRFRESLVWPLFPLWLLLIFGFPCSLSFMCTLSHIDSSRKSILVTTPRLDNFIGIFQWLDVMLFISLDFIGHSYWFICQFFFHIKKHSASQCYHESAFKGWMVREDNPLYAAQKSTLRHVSRSGELREELITLLVYDEESTNLQGSADVIDSTSIDASTHISFVCSWMSFTQTLTRWYLSILVFVPD